MIRHGFVAIKRRHLMLVERISTDRDRPDFKSTHEAWSFSGPYFQPTREDINAMILDIEQIKSDTPWSHCREQVQAYLGKLFNVNMAPKQQDNHETTTLLEAIRPEPENNDTGGDEMYKREDFGPGDA